MEEKESYENGLVLPNEQMREIDERGYKYLGIVEMDKIKETEMKEKFPSEYKRRLKSLLKTIFDGRNTILAINTWAVSVLGYGARILKLKVIDRTLKNIMTMNGAFHPKSDTELLYLTRERGGHGLVICEGCVRSEEKNLGSYVNILSSH